MTNEPDLNLDANLLQITTKLNTYLLAAMCGFVAGISLLIFTFISLNRGLPDPGHYLNLLGYFMPGYEVSNLGAWIGLFWGFVYGAIAGAIIYRIYAKTIPEQVEQLVSKHSSYQDINYIILKINSSQFGIAMGILFAAGTFIATNVLVLKGTAEQSYNMALLAYYLPGYAVSFGGSIIGAIEMFVIIYAACFLFGTVYNKIVNRKHKA